jgi:hypothetical protein
MDAQSLGDHRAQSKIGQKGFSRGNKYREEEEESDKLKLVKKAIDCITDCCFDNGCILIFKKLGNICVSKRKIMFSTNSK